MLIETVVIQHSHKKLLFVSQGSVATHLKCGGIFSDGLVIAHFPQCMPVKEC